MRIQFSLSGEDAKIFDRILVQVSESMGRDVTPKEVFCGLLRATEAGNVSLWTLTHAMERPTPVKQPQRKREELRTEHEADEVERFFSPFDDAEHEERVQRIKDTW